MNVEAGVSADLSRDGTDTAVPVSANAVSQAWFDLGYGRPKFVNLADFLATHPRERRICEEHGWFTETIASLP